MSATRTQIYLTEDQRRRIDAVATARGWTMAETIRQVLDGYLDELSDVDATLDATFGADPAAEAPSRDDWRG